MIDAKEQKDLIVIFDNLLHKELITKEEYNRCIQIMLKRAQE